MTEPIVLRLSFAFHDIDELSQKVIEKHASHLRELDLTANRFSDLISLRDFTKLETLILDSNLVTAQTKIPKLPNLTTLWVNKNKISNLAMFISKVSESLPNLKYLSMLGNDACPNFLNGGSPLQYQDYRHFVISKLVSLLHLDSTPITDQEREAAWKKYKPEKIKGSKSASSLVASSSTSSANAVAASSTSAPQVTADSSKTIEKTEVNDTTKKKKKKKKSDNVSPDGSKKKKKKGKKADASSETTTQQTVTRPTEAIVEEEATVDKTNSSEKAEAPEKMTKTKKNSIEGLLSSLPDISQLDLAKKQEKIQAKASGKRKTNVDYDDDEWSSDEEFDSELLDDEEWDE